MKLSTPFFISARLAPALKIGDAVLSFDRGQFVFDFADGSSHVVTDFQFPKMRIRGTCDERFLQDGFSAILSFLGACAESRLYATRKTGDPMNGENSGLFPDVVGAWAEMHSDEIAALDCEITEAADLITAD